MLNPTQPPSQSLRNPSGRPSFIASATRLFVFTLMAVSALAQPAQRLELGRLATGDVVAFVREAGDSWGMEVDRVAGPDLHQMQPARIEVYRRDGGPRGLAAGYDSVVVSEPGGVTARARVADEAGVVFKALKKSQALYIAILAKAMARRGAIGPVDEPAIWRAIFFPV